MTYPQKVVGQLCENCGVGHYVKNPKTGKVFCDEKCWLKWKAVEELQAAMGAMRIWAQDLQRKMKTESDELNRTLADLDRRIGALEIPIVPSPEEKKDETKLDDIPF